MAKIDIRENRAEMPERRNVLRKVISPAVARWPWRSGRRHRRYMT